jgi:hypothetical protein
MDYEGVFLLRVICNSVHEYYKASKEEKALLKSIDKKENSGTDSD